jgi:hypothetical protein
MSHRKLRKSSKSRGSKMMPGLNHNPRLFEGCGVALKRIE